MTFLRLIGADVADAGSCAAGSRKSPPAKAATAAMGALITYLLVHGTGAGGSSTGTTPLLLEMHK
jgi:hypothetical protein